MKIILMVLWIMTPDGNTHTDIKQVDQCPPYAEVTAPLEQMVNDKLIVTYGGWCGETTVHPGEPV